MAAHERLKNELTQDEKYHNLMRRFILFYFLFSWRVVWAVQPVVYAVPVVRHARTRRRPESPTPWCCWLGPLWPVFCWRPASEISWTRWELDTVPKWYSVFGQTCLGKQCRPRSGCSFNWCVQLICTVCCSIHIVWMHYCMVKLPWSLFKVWILLDWEIYSE